MAITEKARRSVTAAIRAECASREKDIKNVLSLLAGTQPPTEEKLKNTITMMYAAGWSKAMPIYMMLIAKREELG